MAEIFGFPNPVNEKAARSVAAGVVVLSVVGAITGWWVVLLVLAYGFAARVASGPRLSPLGQLATRVIAPRLGTAKLVPGPPKRFAQAIGLAFSGGALVFNLIGLQAISTVLLIVLAVFATLESVLGFCAGCFVFAQLMRLGIIPEDTCAACADISLRGKVSA
ncbi:MAG TPA: DUF4395 domain-containing protein [Flexivirga sp.]|uniref:DUF4395 domain-containing protein n=1 Tax=Flexivirga sp. TaxID=1962927 RepID=UPI002BFB97C8|nr:DUF4395 domain-containing protein [Flexivirga sp.]HWC24149.1 DUF4395 domain-containing protein [Flexivirga sp.]